MPPTLSPQEFVVKWRQSTLKERSAAQEHFRSLPPGRPPHIGRGGPPGQTFAFEAGATKQRGGEGWADTWKSERIAMRFKPETGTVVPLSVFTFRIHVDRFLWG
jgi:hypothetical protein